MQKVITQRLCVYDVHAVNVRIYAPLQQRRAQLYFELDVDTPHEDAFSTSCWCVYALRNVPLILRPGTRSRIYLYVSTCPLFIQVHREMMTSRNIFRGRNPRIIVKGDSATQKRLFPFSYYNATTSITAYDLLSVSRLSAISSG